MIRTRTRSAAAALAAGGCLLAGLAAGASAAPRAMIASYSGVVVKDDMGMHTFTLRSANGTHVIHTNGRTRWVHLAGFSALKKGTHVAVRARIDESTHAAWATRVSEMM